MMKLALLLPLIAAAGCVSPAEPARQPIQVPFVVSDYYSPDGFFGDGETRGQLELNMECPDRPPGRAATATPSSIDRG
jgi:hypothetical protein